MRRKKDRESGQAMVEFALVLPILLLIVCGIIDFGWLFFNQLSLDNACREGARYATVHSINEDCEALTAEHVQNIISPVIDNVTVTITYSSEADRLAGDVTVKLEAQMNILTPVLGIISGGQTRPITSEVTMKVET